MEVFCAKQSSCFIKWQHLYFKESAYTLEKSVFASHKKLLSNEALLLMALSRGVVKRGAKWACLFPILGTMKTIAFSTNAQSRFASIVLDSTSASSAAYLVVSLYFCSSRSNAGGKLQALEGRSVSSKSPLRVRSGDKSCSEELQKIVFPDEGSLICPTGKSIIFTHLTPLIFDCLRPPLDLSMVQFYDAVTILQKDSFSMHVAIDYRCYQLDFQNNKTAVR